MYLGVRGIDFTSLYDFDICFFFKVTTVLVFYVFHFSISNNYAYSSALLIFILFYFKVPGHLRTINSPIYGKEDHKLDIIKDKYEIGDSDLNTNTQIDNVYDEISDENSINMDPRYINTSPIRDV